MDEAMYEGQEDNDAPPRRTKNSQRKVKSVHSMYQIPASAEHAMPHPLRRIATAPPAYMNNSFYVNPNAPYGQPMPGMYPAPYYPGFQNPGSPVYYPPAQQPTVIIRQNQRVISPGRDRYDDNNETFEGFFGPDVPRSSQYVHHTPIRQQQEQFESYERSRSPHSYHSPDRHNNDMSVAEARALEEAIQLSLTESSRLASRPNRPRDGSFNTEDFESGFTTMSASSNDNGVTMKSPEALADEKALQEAILLSLRDSGSYDEYQGHTQQGHTQQGHGQGQAITSQQRGQRYITVPPAPPVISPSAAATGRQYPYNLSPELRKKSSFRSSFEGAPYMENYLTTYEDRGANAVHVNKSVAVPDHVWETPRPLAQTQAQTQKAPPPRRHEQHLSLDVVIPPLPLHTEELGRIEKYSSQYRHEAGHPHPMQSPRDREHFDPRRSQNTRSSYPPDRHRRTEELHRTMSAPINTDRSATLHQNQNHNHSFHQYHHADPRGQQQQQQQQQATRAVAERRSASATRVRPAENRAADSRWDAELRVPQRRGVSTSPPRARGRPTDNYPSAARRPHDRHNEVYTPRSDQLVVPSRSASDRPVPPPAPLQKQLSNHSILYDSYASASEFENSEAYSRPPPEPPSYAASRRSDTLRHLDSTTTLVRPAPPVIPQRGYSTSTVQYDGDAYNSTSEAESRQHGWPAKAAPVIANYREPNGHNFTKPTPAMRPPPPFAPQRDLSNATVQYDSQAYTGASDSDSGADEPYEDIRMQSSRKNSPRDDSLAGPGPGPAGTSYLSPRREAQQDDPLSSRRVYPGPSLHKHRPDAPTHQQQGHDVHRASGYGATNAMY